MGNDIDMVCVRFKSDFKITRTNDKTMKAKNISMYERHLFVIYSFFLQNEISNWFC